MPMSLPTMDADQKDYFISRSRKIWEKAKRVPVKEEEEKTCPECNGTGVLTSREGVQVRTAICACQERLREQQRLINSGLPENLVQRCTFDSFQVSYPWQQDMKRIAQDYTTNCRGWLLFGGQSGSGKTHMAIAAAAELLQQGRQVCYMSWRQEVGSLKRQDFSLESRTKRMEQLQNCQVLLIDDLLQTEGNMTTADVNLATEILGRRYDREAPTILTTQWYIKDIARAYEPLGSRIMELTAGRRVVVEKDKKYDMRIP